MVDSQNIILKYYDETSDLYKILIHHSEQVKDKALESVARHPELSIDREFVAEASMLHDIGIFLCNAPSIQCFGTHQYIEHGYLGADLVRKEGFPQHALVCERHTGVGLPLEWIIEKELPLPHRDLRPVSLEEQLICYADKFFSKSKLNSSYTPDQIVTKLERFDKNHPSIFLRWHELFG